MSAAEPRRRAACRSRTAGASDHALEDVTVRLEPGGSLGLLGPNGAGKSTLFKAVLGLVPVVRGRVEVLGATPSPPGADVAYVPQADTLDAEFPVSAEQVVLMGRYRRIGWLRRPGRADRRAARAALERVGLADKARHAVRGAVGRPAPAGAAGPGHRPGGPAAAARRAVQRRRRGQPAGAARRPRRLRAEGAAVVLSTHDLALAHLACSEACLLNRHQHGFGPPADRAHARAPARRLRRREPSPSRRARPSSSSDLT